jgi:hypothetical protein
MQERNKGRISPRMKGVVGLIFSTFIIIGVIGVVVGILYPLLMEQISIWPPETWLGLISITITLVAAVMWLFIILICSLIIIRCWRMVWTNEPAEH